MAAKSGGGGRRASPKSKLTTVETGPPRVVGPGDNILTAAEKKEAIYRKYMVPVKTTLADVDRAKAELKELVDAHNIASTEFKNATKISKANLKAILAKLKQTGPRSELTKEAIDYNFMAEMEGIPVGGQMSLIGALENTPEATRDALDWEGEGWRAYSRNLECKPPKECPGKFITDWTRGWHAHQERVIWGMAHADAAAKPEPVTAPEVEPAADPFEASP